MSALGTASQIDQVQRIEELGRIILAYSEVTEKLQQSHEQLTATLASLRAELSEKNQQLERKNRLAALGEMAAGMAHEIRNPLGGIQLYASMLAKDVGEQPGALGLVNKISGGVRRLEALVSQVLQFTREVTVHVEETDLAAVVETAVELAAPRIADRRLNVQVRGERPFIVRADQHLLGQAVLNLVLNAAEAMEEGGTLRVQYSAASEADGAR